MSAVFTAADLSVSFGGVRALQGVNLEVGDGELVGLIGPNGAGKTTFIDAVTGFVASKGRVTLDGTVISELTPHQRARKGVARTWQSVDLFDDLTVEQNLVVAAKTPTLGGTLGEMVRWRRSGRDIGDALGVLGLDDTRFQLPNELSLGRRKLVGVARAIVARPRLLCLDEPAAGLDSAESRVLGQQLRQLSDAGQAMLLIDHDMGLVFSVCDRVVVIDFGQVIAQGTPREVSRDERVLAAYLGTSGTPALAGSEEAER